MTDEDLQKVLKARFDKGNSSMIIMLRLENCQNVTALPKKFGKWRPLQQEQQAHQRFSEIGAQADPRYRAS